MNDIWRDLLHARADVTLAIGLVLAIGVTMHILLTKREVASAVGWMGLVWFAPIVGAICYAVLGVNRVKRRASQLRPLDASQLRLPDANQLRPPDDGTDDARHSPVSRDEPGSLARGIGRLTDRPLLPGTDVQTFCNGDAAYPPMLSAIANAKISIGLSSYIFRDDQWGRRFIDALAAARARGVEVRVLIDGIGGGWLMSRAYHRLRHRGVTAARFMHSLLPWRMPFFNLRSHRKILIIDGVIGFTGGMNIADENVMATNPHEPVQDLHFRIDGPVVSQLAEAFAEDWAFVTGEDLSGNTWFPQPPARRGASARVIDSGPDEDVQKIEFAVLQAIGCARTSVAVMTPYFLPDERLITALSLASMRGVAIDVIMPEKGNHTLVNWATRANVGPLLAAGVRIWQSPPPFHHTKIMVVDSEWCLIGSCNWDIRSFRLNFELCVEVYDRDLAARLTAVMDSARGPALTQENLDSRSLSLRLRDAGARLMLPYL